MRGVATASARLLGVRESVRFGGRWFDEWKEDEEERRLFLATGEYSVENSMKEPGESAEYGWKSAVKSILAFSWIPFTSWKSSSDTFSHSSCSNSSRQSSIG